MIIDTTATDTGRIASLDAVRGVAVMGIFSVNVVGMAMIEIAYFHPPAFGFDSLADRIMWLANFILIDGKMRSLFSILFGASCLLVMDRAERAGRSGVAIHVARMAALLVIGLAHFYLIWWGDILTLYAVVGLAALLFRKLDARWLCIAGILCLAYYTVPRIEGAQRWFDDYRVAHAPGASDADRSTWRSREANFLPPPSEIAEDRADHESAATFIRHTTTDRRWEPIDTLGYLWIETLGLMLLGMAAFRSGFLSGRWSRRSYRMAALAGLGSGLVAFTLLGANVWRSGFRLPEVATAVFTYSVPFRAPMALGYAALVILLLRPGGWLSTRVTAVGRAALTNYLGASLFGAALFMGWGAGLYGKLSRAEAWLIVPPVWLAMLAWSKPWLDRFRYGPFEWAWRSLARWKPQPMRKSA